MPHGNGKRATPTEEGERLLSDARRILSLAEEARDVVARPGSEGVTRLGIPEDFAANRLTRLLSKFARSRPGLRLDVRCDLSVKLRSDIERGELDLALMKRDVSETGAIAAWPENLVWVTSRSHPVDLRRDPVPLAVFSQGCLIAIARSTRSKRPDARGMSPTRAPTSPASKPQSAGLGVSVLPDTAILADHQVLRVKDGFPSVGNTELALVAAPDASPVIYVPPSCSPSFACLRPARSSMEGRAQSVAQREAASEESSLAQQMRGKSRGAEDVCKGAMAHIEAAGKGPEGRHD